MKLFRKKISLAFVCLNILFLLSCLNVLAFSSTEENKNPAYYFLSLAYDSEANSVSLNPDGFAVDVTDINLTNDTGSGSQFFAKVIGGDAKSIQFKSGTDKFFLGQWKMVKFTEGHWDPVTKKRVGGGPVAIKKGGVQATVPYFPDGQKIEIYDAKTNKLAVSADVSKFSQPETAASQVGNASSANQTATSQPATQNAATQTAPKQGFPWFWIAVGFFILLLAGVAFILYKRYKKYKSQILP